MAEGLGRCCLEMHHGTDLGDKNNRKVPWCNSTQHRPSLTRDLTIHHFKSEKQTGAETRHAILSGIVTDAPGQFKKTFLCTSTWPPFHCFVHWYARRDVTWKGSKSQKSLRKLTWPIDLSPMSEATFSQALIEEYKTPKIRVFLESHLNGKFN